VLLQPRASTTPPFAFQSPNARETPSLNELFTIFSSTVGLCSSCSGSLINLDPAEIRDFLNAFYDF
jgi:hypothetical protein